MADIATILTDSSNYWSAGTKVLFPSDDGFAEVTSRWAVHKPPTYAAAISPASEEDVVKTVSVTTESPNPVDHDGFHPCDDIIIHTKTRH